MVGFLFCDLIGLTALSARFDPEELREEIRAYQNARRGPGRRGLGAGAGGGRRDPQTSPHACRLGRR